MALDLSAASLIRSGSGLLYLTLAIALALIARRGVGDTRLAAALALHCGGFGWSFIAFNLGARDPALSAWFLGASAVGWASALAGLVWMLVVLRPNRTRAIAYALAGVAMLGAAILATLDFGMEVAFLLQLPPTGLVVYAGMFPIVLATLGFAVLVAIELSFAHVARGEGAARRGLALLAIGIVAYPAHNFGESLVGLGLFLFPSAKFLLILLVATFCACIARWLAASKHAPRLATSVAMVVPAFGLLGMLSTTLLEGDDSGLVGIVRIGTAIVLAVAILKHDVLGAKLQVRAVRRGTLATGALAALFIVAQIAQNFLSAQYGLIMGGIVAGAFLFAAQPMQRAFESRSHPRGESAPPHEPAIFANDRARKEDMYRRALRIALIDRVVTRDEELHLFQLAEELGIGAGRAMELRHEIEREGEREARG